MIRCLFGLMLLISCMTLAGCGGREATVVVPDETVVTPEMDENYDPTGGSPGE